MWTKVLVPIHTAQQMEQQILWTQDCIHGLK